MIYLLDNRKTIDVSASNTRPMFLVLGLRIISQSPILITVMSCFACD